MPGAVCSILELEWSYKEGETMKKARIMALSSMMLVPNATGATKTKTFVNNAHTAIEVQMVYTEQVNVPQGPYKGKKAFKDSVHRINIKRHEIRRVEYPAQAQVKVITIKSLAHGFFAQWGYRPEGEFALFPDYPFVQDLLQPAEYALYLDKQYKKFLEAKHYSIARSPALQISLKAGGLKVMQK